jgi:hypothetical protein
MLRKMGDWLGFTVHATDGDVGTIDDFYVDDVEWTVRYLVVDTGPWLLGRRVLLSPLALTQLRWDARTAVVSLTQEQIEQSPEVDENEPITRQQLIELNKHYGWPAPWKDAPLVGTTEVAQHPEIHTEEHPVQEAAPETGQRQAGTERPLRSVKEVIGYGIAAQDGEIGHVEDLFVDEAGWVLRYLLVNTRDWLPGRDVLVAIDWVERVGWTDSLVHVDVTRDQVKKSPEYDPAKTPDRSYETELFEYYQRMPYWMAY